MEKVADSLLGAYGQALQAVLRNVSSFAAGAKGALDAAVATAAGELNTTVQAAQAVAKALAEAGSGASLRVAAALQQAGVRLPALTPPTAVLADLIAAYAAYEKLFCAAGVYTLPVLIPTTFTGISGGQHLMLG